MIHLKKTLYCYCRHTRPVICMSLMQVCLFSSINIEGNISGNIIVNNQICISGILIFRAEMFPFPTAILSLCSGSKVPLWRSSSEQTRCQTRIISIVSCPNLSSFCSCVGYRNKNRFNELISYTILRYSILASYNLCPVDQCNTFSSVIHPQVRFCLKVLDIIVLSNFSMRCMCCRRCSTVLCLCSSRNLQEENQWPAAAGDQGGGGGGRAGSDDDPQLGSEFWLSHNY